MTIPFLIQKIRAGIIRQEGNPITSTNPGGIRDCPWFPYKAFLYEFTQGTTHNAPSYQARAYPDGKQVQFAHGFWVPRTREEGIAGIDHCVALRIAEGQTLAQLITAWAPPSDHNQTADYIANLKQWAGIPDENMALWSYVE